MFSIGAAALTVALVAGLLIALSGSSNPPWPSSIAPIAAFVSHDRGLSFTHTVPVHFLSAKVFDHQIAQQDRATTPSERVDNARAAAEYRALGLLGGAVNLNAAQTSLDAGSVLAYYDDQAKDIVVRGTHLDPATKITVAHELTHTLQDQHFDLPKLDNESNTADSSFAETSVVEGDAVLTENDYAASLPAAQQRQATAEENAQSGGSSPGRQALTNDSTYLDIVSSEPYVLGPDFVLVLYQTGGPTAINRAFTTPPQTQLEILDPSTYLLRTPTTTPKQPTLPKGTTRDGTSDAFGAFDTYLTLAGYMDARVALAAADGWGGGTYVQYRQKSQVCTKIDVVGRSNPATVLLSSTFSNWAASLPLHQATVVTHGSNVTITACDPGPKVTPGPRSLSHALDIADSRNANLGDAFYYGVTSPVVARCVGDQALGDQALLNAEFVANTYSAPSASVQHVLDTETKRLISLCRSAHPPAST